MIRAVIFDLDGLLADTEHLWRQAETECFAVVGVRLDESLCRETTGLRVEEVVDHWHARWPWPDAVASRGELVEAIVDRVGALMVDVRPKPGAIDAVRFCADRGARLAVASSSSPGLIAAALASLGIADRFEVSRSGLEEELGKPHPAIFLSTAAKLGVPPAHCLVVEDSLNGVIAGKAARMRCLAVPEFPDPGFAVADALLDDLTELDDEVWARLSA